MSQETANFSNLFISLLKLCNVKPYLIMMTVDNEGGSTVMQEGQYVVTMKKENKSCISKRTGKDDVCSRRWIRDLEEERNNNGVGIVISNTQQSWRVIVTKILLKLR